MTKLDPFVLTIDHDTWLDFFDAAVVSREKVPARVVVAGMPGSGTTLLAQIVRSFGITLTKLHNYSDAPIMKLVMYRDPRDLVCGAALRQLKAVTETEGIAAGQVAAYKYLLDYHTAFEQYAEDARSHLFKYERYLPDRIQSLVYFVAAALGLTLRRWFIEYLAWEFSLQRNKERAALLTDGFGDIDQVTGIHGNHITMDGATLWEGKLCPEALRLINENLSEFMTKWGYL